MGAEFQNCYDDDGFKRSAARKNIKSAEEGLIVTEECL